MGLLGRLWSKSLERRAQRVYFDEVARLATFGRPRSIDPSGIYEVHHLAWNLVLEQVFPRRGPIEIFGLVPGKAMEIDQLYRLGAMHGITRQALDQHQADLNAERIAEAVKELRAAFGELQSTSDPERREYLVGFCRFLRQSILPGHDPDGDRLVAAFDERYG